MVAVPGGKYRRCFAPRHVVHTMERSFFYSAVAQHTAGIGNEPRQLESDYGFAYRLVGGQRLSDPNNLTRLVQLDHVVNDMRLAGKVEAEGAGQNQRDRHRDHAVAQHPIALCETLILRAQRSRCWKVWAVRLDGARGHNLRFHCAAQSLLVPLPLPLMRLVAGALRAKGEVPD